MNRSLLFYIVVPPNAAYNAQLPLGAHKLSSYLSLSGINSLVLDFSLFDYEYFLMSSPAYAIGFSCPTGSHLQFCSALASKLRSKAPLVIGGNFPSAYFSTPKLFDSFDYVVAGEGESCINELLRRIDSGSGERLIISPPHTAFATDIDAFYNNTKLISEYVFNRDNLGSAINIETSRGCPYRCRFCHNSNSSMYKAKSADIVSLILRNIAFTAHIDGIVFQEDNFFVNISRALEIGKAIKVFGLKWKANCRVDTLLRILSYSGLLDMFISTGLTVLQIGIESGSDAVLSSIGKGFTRADIIALSSMISKYNVFIKYNFIVGFPNESESDMMQSFELIELLRKSNDRVFPPFVNIYYPYRSSALYATAVSAGYVAPATVEQWASVDWGCVDHVTWLDAPARKALHDKVADFRKIMNYTN